MKKGKYQKRGTAAKATLLVLALVLLIGGTIGGVIAYLMDSTDSITNTFTYGMVDIELTETLGGESKEFKMVPGNMIAKDPKITVSDDSEDCYLFVKLEKSDNYSTYLEDYVLSTGWNELSGVDGVYYREAKANDAFYVLQAGTGDYANGYVQVKTGVTKAQMEAIKTSNQPTLKITAYAVQKANIGTAAEAWEKF